jgi:hypothetical protein
MKCWIVLLRWLTHTTAPVRTNKEPRVTVNLSNCKAFDEYDFARYHSPLPFSFTIQINRVQHFTIHKRLIWSLFQSIYEIGHWSLKRPKLYCRDSGSTTRQIRVWKFANINSLLNNTSSSSCPFRKDQKTLNGLWGSCMTSIHSKLNGNPTNDHTVPSECAWNSEPSDWTHPYRDAQRHPCLGFTGATMIQFNTFVKKDRVSPNFQSHLIGYQFNASED